MREKEAERTLKIYSGECSHTEKTHQGLLGYLQVQELLGSKEPQYMATRMTK